MRNQRSYTVDPADFDLEPESSNYYPITTGIEKRENSIWQGNICFFTTFLFWPAMYIRNSANDTHLSVLTDRSQGGGSITDNQVNWALKIELITIDTFSSFSRWN